MEILAKVVLAVPAKMKGRVSRCVQLDTKLGDIQELVRTNKISAVFRFVKACIGTRFVRRIVQRPCGFEEM